jgi:putative restriction endonuclease
MKFYVGVTDPFWYNHLKKLQPVDINFWQPGGNTPFKVLQPGEPFLFKLRGAANAIAGMAFFANHIRLPVSIAWQTFGDHNGRDSHKQFLSVIQHIRNDHSDINPTIGCIVLTNPIFFEERDWIPGSYFEWSGSIVQGKSYSTNDTVGSRLWNRVEALLSKTGFFDKEDQVKSQFVMEEPLAPRYGNPYLSKVRLGQDAFRTMVMGAYDKKCAISGEKTLPVLDAAHIKEYAQSGPHLISNGLLLRTDLHKLFDSGYITLTSDLTVEVSKRIKEEFENGREYYRFHGEKLKIIPQREQDRPALEFIHWHNTEKFEKV